MAETGLQLRSEVKSSGELELTLAEVPAPAPGADEVLVRVQATPINPSDLGLLIGPADLSGIKVSGSAERPVVTAPIPAQFMKMLAARADQALPVGNEGAGVVIAAGSDPKAQALLGKTVAMIGGAMYATHRLVKAADVLVLPDDATAADGASCFVNPLTALGMVETMRLEGHSGLVHTAAASNLGQMLNRICLAEGVPLVNLVRKAEQVALLRDQGARHVLDMTQPGFTDALADALTETGATLAFDAIGGGRQAGQILAAMEVAANRRSGGAPYNRYGSNTYKQVYIYGGLDTGPTEFNRAFGFAWGLGGWLLTPFLAKIGPEATERLRQRVRNELKTTFASRYTREISLVEALNPEIMAAYNRKATGEKFLINPSKELG
jgi:NADPH:quinone reductase